MKKITRTRLAGAVVSGVSLILQPLAATIVAGAMQAQPAAKPAGAAAKPAAQTPAKTTTAATAKPAAGSTAVPIDGGWPRAYDLASGGSMLVYQPQISSWETQKHLVAVQRRVASRHGRGEAGARDGQVRSRHERLGRRPPGQAAEPQDRRSEFPDAAERAGAGDYGRRSTRRFPTTIESSRSIACWRTSTRVRSSRRTSKA